MRSVFGNARRDLDQALAYRCGLSLGQRAGLRDGGAHAMQPVAPERSHGSAKLGWVMTSSMPLRIAGRAAWNSSSSLSA
jgi:hypothetical protein